jgi:hypothetical protein
MAKNKRKVKEKEPCNELEQALFDVKDIGKKLESLQPSVRRVLIALASNMGTRFIAHDRSEMGPVAVTARVIALTFDGFLEIKKTPHEGGVKLSMELTEKGKKLFYDKNKEPDKFEFMRT